MPHVRLEVDKSSVQAALRQTKSLLAYWTSGWDSPKESPWWWVCCDNTKYDVDEIESGNCRRQIRKGLRNVDVQQIDQKVFIEKSYPIYRDAIISYGSNPQPYHSYADELASPKNHTNYEFWGAFAGSTMVAYAACQVAEEAVGLGATKSDPKYHSLYPNRALFFTITRHYLTNGYRYITNGHRTLWHPTAINEFLCKMGYRRVYATLNVELAPIAHLIYGTKLARWGRYAGLRKLFSKQWNKLCAFDELMSIVEQQTNS